MKTLDLKNKSHEDLIHLLSESQAKILKLRFDLADKKLKNYSEIKKTRKNIARILTALNKAK